MFKRFLLVAVLIFIFYDVEAFTKSLENESKKNIESFEIILKSKIGTKEFHYTYNHFEPQVKSQEDLDELVKIMYEVLDDAKKRKDLTAGANIMAAFQSQNFPMLEFLLYNYEKSKQEFERDL